MSNDEDDIAYLVEIPGVYDGWSVAVHKDGSMANRWASSYEAYPASEVVRRRYEAAQKWIESEKAVGLVS